MKIALLGTCQMVNLGRILQQVFTQNNIPAQVVYHEKMAQDITNESYLSLMDGLEAADIVYCQYYRDRLHRNVAWSTDNLRKYFNVKVVPMLLSPVSTPQFFLWNEFRKEDEIAFLNGIDFRFLELYLDGATYAEAARRYQDIVITPQQIEAGIIDRVESYRSRFNQGLEAFDYAPFYEESVRKDLRSFSLFNHPDNAQLSWLGSQILKDIGIQANFALQGPELLLSTLPTNLFGKSDGGYYFNYGTRPIAAVAKIYFGYFASLDRDWLSKEYLASGYYKNYRSGHIPLIRNEIILHRPAAAAI